MDDLKTALIISTSHLCKIDNGYPRVERRDVKWQIMQSNELEMHLCNISSQKGFLIVRLIVMQNVWAPVSKNPSRLK